MFCVFITMFTIQWIVTDCTFIINFFCFLSMDKILNPNMTVMEYKNPTHFEESIKSRLADEINTLLTGIDVLTHKKFLGIITKAKEPIKLKNESYRTIMGSFHLAYPFKFPGTKNRDVLEELLNAYLGGWNRAHYEVK